VPYDPLLTIEQIAAQLGVRPNTVYGWRHRGHLPPPDDTRGPNGGILLWRRSTIDGANLPPRRTRLVGRPQA
jgi:transposase-like protein